MKITQIRNATNRLVYAGKTFLIDPWLSPSHMFTFADVPGHPYHIPDQVKEHLPMPFYDLPMSTEEILEDVEDNVPHASITRHVMRGRLASRGVVNYDMPADGESVVY